MMRESARVLATELIRKPVKDAVREALREETATVRSTTDTTDVSSKERSAVGSVDSEQQRGGGGPSRVAVIGIVLAIASVAYLARRRMSSSTGGAWSEPSAGEVATDDAEGGYVSEGEMQTAETADEGDSDME